MSLLDAQSYDRLIPDVSIDPSGKHFTTRSYGSFENSKWSSGSGENVLSFPFQALKIQIQILVFFEKKYLHIANVVLYYCVNYQNKILYILGSVKIIKSYKNKNQIFTILFITVYGFKNLSLSFLPSPKYNIF
jgi:hypothetical protein